MNRRFLAVRSTFTADKRTLCRLGLHRWIINRQTISGADGEIRAVRDWWFCVGCGARKDRSTNG